ncbi:MAG: sensor histidine kinase [Opitutales bacterium]
MALAGYISYWSEKDSLQQFEEMARTNAKFIDELKLPKSAALAEKLSTVLGVWVGFYHTTGETPQFANTPWSSTFRERFEQALMKQQTSFQSGGKDVAIAPFESDTVHLVLVRQTQSLISTGLGKNVLVPAILLAMACGSLAYYLAHRIVLPLATLTNWLPHLEHDDRAAPEIPHPVAQRGDEIGELARALEATHRRLREEQERRRQSERMATLGRIATSLAHEIRNPAASIGLHADLLARSAHPSNAESVGLIRAEVDRINDLVNQWLFVVRPAPPQTSRHDLVALVSRIAQNLRTTMEHGGARLHLSEPDAPLPVNCDHARIEQVLRNLLVNAMQAMPEGGEIKISFETSDKYALCLIQDAGTGFSKEALLRFGEAFYSEREGGMGIGLTLAREVITAHEGSIDAANAPEGGAIVRLRLPHANENKTS